MNRGRAASTTMAGDPTRIPLGVGAALGTVPEVVVMVGGALTLRACSDVPPAGADTPMPTRRPT